MRSIRVIDQAVARAQNNNLAGTGIRAEAHLGPLEQGRGTGKQQHSQQ